MGIKKKINLKRYRDENLNIILRNIIKYKPQEIYFFSGQSSVNLSFENPLETYESNINILFEILELLRVKKLNKIKVFAPPLQIVLVKVKIYIIMKKNLFFQ